MSKEGVQKILTAVDLLAQAAPAIAAASDADFPPLVKKMFEAVHAAFLVFVDHVAPPQPIDPTPPKAA